jgi:peptidoglycan hydrolase-like protein with peptidoglycan-binding domain
MENAMTFVALAARTLLAGLALAVASSAALAWTLGPPTVPARSFSITPVAASVDEMPPEMRRAYIVGIQEELRQHGYRPGPADGIMGARTRGAIRAYERDAKLPVTGMASKEILDHMKFVQPKVKARPGRAKSQLVLDIQKRLGGRGYYDGALDGLNGPQTKTAAMRFQRDAKLAVTGKVDLLLVDDLKRVDPTVRAAEVLPAN